MTKDEVVGQLYKAQSDLQDALPGLLARAADDAQRSTIMKRYVSLRDVYFYALAADLKDFNETVQHLYGELEQATKELKSALDSEKNVLKIIGLITEVIKLAGGIAAAAAV